MQIWRGEAETGEEEVTVWGRAATLKLWGPTTTAATRPGSYSATTARRRSSAVPRSSAPEKTQRSAPKSASDL